MAHTRSTRASSIIAIKSANPSFPQHSSRYSSSLTHNFSQPLMSTLPSLLIAAPLSESGKSTLTMGLLRAYTRRGLATQAFKCGPDYVDPKLHLSLIHI